MKSLELGTNTSKIEVTNISNHGLWIFVNENEYFLSFEDYPWFTEAKISDILDVKLLHKKHLFWEKLDVDLELDSLKNPEKYPLIYK